MPTTTDTKPIIFAHRGASGYEPENTIRSFRRALELGANWIELDVQLADRSVWVFHDRLLYRRANVNQPLAELSKDEIQALDVGLREKIPLLTEVLDLVLGKASINIEIKGLGVVPELVKILQTALANGWSADQFLISSFDSSQTALCKKLLPEVSTALLVYGFPNSIVEQAKLLGACTVNINIDFLTPERVQLLKDAGLAVNVYTANSEIEWKILRNLQVDGVFSDYPDKASAFWASAV